MKYDLVLLTVYFSVFMQFLTSAIQFDGIFIKLPEEHGILTDILKMETIVQVIEACFYVWLIFNFKNIDLAFDSHLTQKEDNSNLLWNAISFFAWYEEYLK